MRNCIAYCLALVVACFGFAQNTSNYIEQGGARTVIGGSLDVISGGELDIESGGALKIAGTAVTATAAQLNSAGGGTVTATSQRIDLSFMDFTTAAGVALTTTPAASSHGWNASAGGVVGLVSVTASEATQTGNSYITIALPANYVPASAVTLKVRAAWAGGEDGGAASRIDATVKKLADSVLGSDIVTTAEQVLTTTATEFSFTITPTGLVAGDLLVVNLKTVVVDDAGGSDNVGYIYYARLETSLYR